MGLKSENFNASNNFNFNASINLKKNNFNFNASNNLKKLQNARKNYVKQNGRPDIVNRFCSPCVTRTDDDDDDDRKAQEFYKFFCLKYKNLDTRIHSLPIQNPLLDIRSLSQFSCRMERIDVR